MSYQVINPFIQFVDQINGKPLSAGDVYFGRMDSDPKNQPANRINVYAVQDNGTEVLLSQPIHLNGAGQPSVDGSVKQIKIELYGTELAYSVQLFNRVGAQKGYSPRVYSLLDGINGVSKAALAATSSTVVIAGVEAKDVAEWSKIVYMPEFFDAVAGEADSTSKLQSMINALPSFGIIDGGNREYNVKSLLLKSNMTMQNIRFKTIAGNTDFVSPISIIGETTPVYIDGVLTSAYPAGAKTNIRLLNVGVNGNRQNQTAIDATREDGGRHGVRILGRVTNITLEECSLEFCGTDGIELFSNNSLPSSENVDDLCFSNIRLINCRISSNRRHGITFDSAFNVKVIDTDSRRNGLDLDTTSPLNSGMRGARFGGNLYGRPFDAEGYGVGSRIVHFEVIGGDFTGNAAGALIYDTADVSSLSFQPRKDITITGATFDATVPASTGGIDASLTIYSTTATASVHAYENVNVSNCTFKTWINFNGVKGVNVVGGSARARYALDTYYALVNKCKKWFLRSIDTDKPNIALDVLPFTAVWSNVIGTPVFTSQDFTLEGFTSNGWLCKYKAVYTAPSTGNYFGTISAAGCKLIPQSSCGTVQATGALFNTGVITSSNDVGVPYTVVATSAQDIEVIFEVIPIA